MFNEGARLGASFKDFNVVMRDNLETEMVHWWVIWVTWVKSLLCLFRRLAPDVLNSVKFYSSDRWITRKWTLFETHLCLNKMLTGLEISIKQMELADKNNLQNKDTKIDVA